MFKEKIIFSIDNGHDLHTMAKFLRHIDTVKAMGKLEGGFIQCIGYYKGKLENSFIMDEKDYVRFVAKLGFTVKQESVLQVPGDTRQPCVLIYQKLPPNVLSPMRKIKPEVASKSKAWTYVVEENTYWTADQKQETLCKLNNTLDLLQLQYQF